MVISRRVLRRGVLWVVPVEKCVAAHTLGSAVLSRTTGTFSYRLNLLRLNFHLRTSFPGWCRFGDRWLAQRVAETTRQLCSRRNDEASVLKIFVEKLWRK